MTASKRTWFDTHTILYFAGVIHQRLHFGIALTVSAERYNAYSDYRD
jgi:hypothetical protein